MLTLSANFILTDDRAHDPNRPTSVLASNCGARSRCGQPTADRTDCSLKRPITGTFYDTIQKYRHLIVLKWPVAMNTE